MNCNGKDHYDEFPTNCRQLRAQVTFPACWDGKNVDSPNHKDHVRILFLFWLNCTTDNLQYPRVQVSYPANFNGGACPSTHPIALPSIFSEWYFDFSKFNDTKFVFANGDTTTNGFHADFINGWTDLDAREY